MKIITRPAIIEQFLEEAALESRPRVDTSPFRQPVDKEHQLVNDLDHAQILKAASHLRRSWNATA